MVGERRNACTIMEKSQGKRPLRKTRIKCKDAIVINLREISREDG